VKSLVAPHNCEREFSGLNGKTRFFDDVSFLQSPHPFGGSLQEEPRLIPSCIMIVHRLFACIVLAVDRNRRQSFSCFARSSRNQSFPLFSTYLISLVECDRWVPRITRCGKFSNRTRSEYRSMVFQRFEVSIYGWHVWDTSNCPRSLSELPAIVHQTLLREKQWKVHWWERKRQCPSSTLCRRGTPEMKSPHRDRS
jgi:hypothetical protein